MPQNGLIASAMTSDRSAEAFQDLAERHHRRRACGVSAPVEIV